MKNNGAVMPLYETLELGKKCFGEALDMSRVIAFWQAKANSPTVARVLRGETTFEDMFRPLAKASLDIDPRVGTDRTFLALATETEKDFENVLPLKGFFDGRYDLVVAPILGRKAAMLNTLKMLVPINGIIGGGAIAVLAMSGLQSWAIWFAAAALVLLSLFEFISLTQWPKKHVEQRRVAIKSIMKRICELDQMVAAAR